MIVVATTYSELSSQSSSGNGLLMKNTLYEANAHFYDTKSQDMATFRSYGNPAQATQQAYNWVRAKGNRGRPWSFKISHREINLDGEEYIGPTSSMY